MINDHFRTITDCHKYATMGELKVNSNCFTQLAERGDSCEFTCKRYPRHVVSSFKAKGE